MAKYAVITINLISKIVELQHMFYDRKLIVTTLTFSKALKRGIDPSILLDNNVWIRAYSHKPVKISGLDEADSESVLVAQELSADLITDDENVEKIAKKMGITVFRYS
ncbi:hypothetical protein [Stygiolobus caldivivus]|uniref:PIN domain-containing protein n=1 Tax=Stygiolobus caldivivus TaxID=2824673 RepID=A0A8D5ZI41_9CREN|nr:hypothetical protein [Stygiolobus caldivivus]BCU69120.1 hypothetical protein KN1_04170 [Stygiolobus caldivivus]